jgi:hypothetical protein
VVGVRIQSLGRALALMARELAERVSVALDTDHCPPALLDTFLEIR